MIKTLGNILKLHSSQRAVIQPIVGCIQELRDQNAQITFKAIYEELSHTQYVILRQMLNQHDKQLARQLVDFQTQQNQNMDAEQEQVSQGYGGNYGSGSVSMTQSEKQAHRKGSQGGVLSQHTTNVTMRNESMKANSGVDTTSHSENNARSRASHSSAGVGANFGQSKQQESAHRVSFSKSNQKMGAQQQANQNSMEPPKQFDDPSYTISPVPSAQALTVAEQKSSSGLAGSQLQAKDQQLK